MSVRIFVTYTAAGGGDVLLSRRRCHFNPNLANAARRRRSKTVSVMRPWPNADILRYIEEVGAATSPPHVKH